MDKRAETACFTGHRIMKMASGEVRSRLSELLDMLIAKGVIYYGCGGALGFDTLAAEVVIEKKRVNPKVKLILVLPCQNQDAKWLPEQRARYSYIKTQADKIVYTSDTYYDGCMLKRNRHLVNNSGICVSLLERNSGGTYYTVRYAMENNLKIYNIMDKRYLEPLEYE